MIREALQNIKTETFCDGKPSDRNLPSTNTDVCARCWWWLMKATMTMIDGPDISEVTRHLHFAWSLPARGIAMATGDSSLRRVSTVTDLLSFISVAGATQPRLIDGISALPQQRGWEVGLLAIDFSTPSNLRISHSPIHLHTHDHVILTYPLTPSSNSSFCSSCVLCKRTVCAHKHNFPAHTHTPAKQVQVHPLPQKQIHTPRRVWWQWRMQRSTGSIDDPLSLLLPVSDCGNSGVLTYSHMHTQLYRIRYLCLILYG